MTEKEAAERLCALLNEMSDQGHEVAVGPELIWVGETVINEPSLADGTWEIGG
jgi:hypothetical protein